jgi:hypothetical protein
MAGGWSRGVDVTGHRHANDAHQGGATFTEAFFGTTHGPSTLADRHSINHWHDTLLSEIALRCGEGNHETGATRATTHTGGRIHGGPIRSAVEGRWTTCRQRIGISSSRDAPGWGGRPFEARTWKRALSYRPPCRHDMGKRQSGLGLQMRVRWVW